MKFILCFVLTLFCFSTLAFATEFEVSEKAKLGSISNIFEVEYAICNSGSGDQKFSLYQNDDYAILFSGKTKMYAMEKPELKKRHLDIRVVHIHFTFYSVLSNNLMPSLS